MTLWSHTAEKIRDMKIEKQLHEVIENSPKDILIHALSESDITELTTTVRLQVQTQWPKTSQTHCSGYILYQWETGIAKEQIFSHL